jgi:hypothetical protein
MSWNETLILTIRGNGSQNWIGYRNNVQNKTLLGGIPYLKYSTDVLNAFDGYS